MDLNNKKCKSVREFFDYLIASGQLLESQKSYDEKSRTKLINGRVTADGRNVVAGLDWSHVRARQFRFNNDTAAEPLISSYDKLPVTTHGISGDLPMPENIVQFLSHNACGHFHAEKERIVIEKNITIVPMKDMDLSRVEVQGSVMWHGGKNQAQPAAESQRQNLRPEKRRHHYRERSQTQRRHHETAPCAAVRLSGPKTQGVYQRDFRALFQLRLVGYAAENFT